MGNSVFSPHRYRIEDVSFLDCFFRKESLNHRRWVGHAYPRGERVLVVVVVVMVVVVVTVVVVVVTVVVVVVVFLVIVVVMVMVMVTVVA